MVTEAPQDLVELRDSFHRGWVCMAVRSGYHNGARCWPDEPHNDWHCGYRWEASLRDTPQTRTLLRPDGEGE